MAPDQQPLSPGPQETDNGGVSRRGLFKVGLGLLVGGIVEGCGASPNNPPTASTPLSETPADKENIEATAAASVDTKKEAGVYENEPGSIIKPEQARFMSEEELLEAIRIPKGLSQEEFMKRYCDTVTDITNLGSDPEEYAGWHTAHVNNINDPEEQNKTYYGYLMNRYMIPLFSQLTGKNLEEREGKLYDTLRYLTLRMAVSLDLHRQLPDLVPITKYRRTVSNISEVNGIITFNVTERDATVTGDVATGYLGGENPKLGFPYEESSTASIRPTYDETKKTMVISLV
jgi:hypothetical protein